MITADNGCIADFPPRGGYKSTIPDNYIAPPEAAVILPQRDKISAVNGAFFHQQLAVAGHADGSQG